MLSIWNIHSLTFPSSLLAMTSFGVSMPQEFIQYEIIIYYEITTTWTVTVTIWNKILFHEFRQAQVVLLVDRKWITYSRARLACCNNNNTFESVTELGSAQ